MPWEFDADKPIYVQIIDRIKLKIISGEILPGSKLSSVRDMAEEAGVNPNTMQRALTELEREALVFSQRTSGRFVTEDKNLIKNMRKSYAKTKMEEMLEALLKIGYTQEELYTFMEVCLGGLS